MTNKSEINLYKSMYYELRKVTRFQLNNYPKPTSKKIKNILKYSLKYLSKKNIDKYSWPNGLMAIGLESSHMNTKDIRDLESLMKYYDRWIKSGQKINYLDNVINGYSMIYIFEQTNDIKYKNALDLLVEYVLNHPVDKYGSLPYRINKKNNNSLNLIYIDSLGMICPFLCRYASKFKKDDLIDIAINQLKNYLNLGFDYKKKLPYHGYNSETKEKLGIVGWGRAVGWLLIGIIDSLEYIDTNHRDYVFLKEKFVEIIDTVLNFQNEDGGFHWQLEADQGPTDTSSTAMIIYSINKGLKTGILDDQYMVYVRRGINFLKSSTINGYVNGCSSECIGLGMYPQKYGNYPWSQGPSLAIISDCL